MKKIFIILISLLCTSLLLANIISQEYYFENPAVTKQQNYYKIKFENTKQFGKIGEPSLPYRGAKLLLPEGEIAISVNIKKYDKIELKDEITLAPIQPQYPLSYDGKIEILDADSPVYFQDAIYPEIPYENLSTHFYSGFGIGFAAITPIEYIPSENKISYYKKVVVEITTEFSQNSKNALKFLHNSDFIIKNLSKIVDNPEAVNSYNLPKSRTDDIDYLILTEESKIEIWQDFANIYLNRGLNVEIFAVEDVEDNFDGVDLQDQIRNFFIEKYTESDIKFILLAGDIDVIPHRGMYGIVNAESDDPSIDYDIPTDLYYACLDRSGSPGDGPDWNNDNDDRWGEQWEADLMPEFAIGRFCYNNNDEIGNFTNKVNSYLNSPIIDETTTALMLGEDLGWAAWGGEYMNEMIDGSYANGYTTVGVPLDWNITTLYDMNGYWNGNDLFPLMSNGPNLINHLGHSGVGYTMKLSTSQVTNTNITNDGTNHNFSIIFTQGCYGGAFDMGDCITEKFTSIANASVSMIANSRYGWGDGGGTDGASQHIHREFIDAIFDENIFELGNALHDAKIDIIPFMSNVIYWCDYETNLIGDPALSIWTDIPQTITAEYLEEIEIGADQIYVSADAINANVVITKNENIVGSGNTGFFGTTTIYFENPVLELTNLTIHISKYNHYPFTGNIEVVASQNAYVVCDNVTYEETGDYIDGSIQSLDEVNLDITLANIGLENTAAEVTANLTSESDFVIILDGTIETTEISASSSIFLDNAFQIELQPGLTDGAEIPLEIEVVSNSDSWTTEIFLQANAPVLEFDNYFLAITSGNNQILEPGETADVYIFYNNIGNGFSYNLATTLYSYDSYITFSGIDIMPQLAPGETNMTITPLEIQIASDCPTDYTIQIELMGIDETATLIESSFDVNIGTYGFDFDDGIEVWNHSALTAGYSDEWHLSTERNHTTDGTFSMKCGSQDEEDYPNYIHAGMTTPEIMLSPNTFAKFYHWMETDTYDESTVWDGGLIEISENGGEFQQIEPIGGYPFAIMNLQTSPFEAETPVFAGEIDWQEVELDLSEFSGMVQLRFVFGSATLPTAEGWYIDDFIIGNYEIVYGDVDGDDNVSSFDAALTLQYSAGLISGWTESQICVADVNSDENISSYDAALILQYSAGLIDEFPVEGK
ncbi:MAG: hypothetical protein H8E33_04245 [Candidatus Cloacimonetes bacterium]|nr:hypothetical protein [Candidatus Cloacimonadota bacterium]